jgi:hypothetical protein
MSYPSVNETNNIADFDAALRPPVGAQTVWYGDKQLRRITRLRLISDPGYPEWELSYCWGEMQDGSKVRVQLGEERFSKKMLKKRLVLMCERDQVYGKGLGLLDDVVISTLC